MSQSIEMKLLLLMLFLLMLGMGATLKISDFKEVIKKPKAFLVGILSQFGWMPLIAFLLSYFLDLSPELAIGLIMLGCTPGGATSNLFTYYSKGDVALSVSMTVATTFLAAFLMPLLMMFYASPFTKQGIVVPYGKIASTMMLVLVPVTIGVLLRIKNEALAKKVEKFGSLSGLLVIAFVIASWIPKNVDLLVNAGPKTYLAAILQGTLGFALGFYFSKSFGLSRKVSRTVSLETGIQNTTLTLSILMLSFNNNRFILVIPMLFAFLIIIMATLVTLVFKFQDKHFVSNDIAERLST